MINIIKEGDIDFSQVSDPIKTEQTIFEQICNLEFEIPFAAVPLAYTINTRGIHTAQNLVDVINKKHPGKKFFVCQHILVKELDFGDNMVFTPHTTESDNYIFIPHYNPIFNSAPVRRSMKERKIEFSFMGDYNTNHLRVEIGLLKQENIISIPTGKWFFSHDEETKKNLKLDYIQILSDTKFPLCPPGTGPSTLRLFESMSLGGIPVIFNDIKLPPDIEECVIRTSLEDFTSGKIKEIISSIDQEKLSNRIYDLYWSKYCNDMLGKIIIEKINN